MRIIVPFLVLLSACGDPTDETHIGGGPDTSHPSAIDSGPDTGHPSATDSVLDTDHPSSVDSQPAPCSWPSYGSDCTEVPYFDCGFGATCVDGKLTVYWHEHVQCDGHDNTIPLVCSHVCANGCVDVEGWPASGAELVQVGCRP